MPDERDKTSAGSGTTTKRRGTKRRFYTDRFTTTDVGLGCALWGIIGGLFIYSAFVLSFLQAPRRSGGTTSGVRRPPVVRRRLATTRAG
jgi:hypothetical protein